MMGTGFFIILPLPGVFVVPAAAGTLSISAASDGIPAGHDRGKAGEHSHGGDRKSDQAANLLDEDAAEMLNFDRVKIVYRSPSAPLKKRVWETHLSLLLVRLRFSSVP